MKMNNVLAHRLTASALVAPALLLMGIEPACAAEAIAPETKTAPASDDASRWTIVVSPYVWAASLHGHARVLGVPTSVDVPFRQTVNHLNASFMGQIQVSRGNFGGYLDSDYTKASNDTTVQSIPVEAQTSVRLLTLGGFYRVYAAPLGGLTSTGQPRQFTVEPTLGLRQTRLAAGVSAMGMSTSKEVTWADGFIGVRVNYDLAERWTVAAHIDASGIGSGSRHSENAQLNLGYRTTLIGHPSVVRVGYRDLHQRYSGEGFDWDVSQRGPGLGVSVQF